MSSEEDEVKRRLEELRTADLDELVHEAKAEEASVINNDGVETQLVFLLTLEFPIELEEARDLVSPPTVYFTENHPDPEVGTWVGCIVCMASASFETVEIPRAEAIVRLYSNKEGSGDTVARFLVRHGPARKIYCDNCGMEM